MSHQQGILIWGNLWNYVCLADFLSWSTQKKATRFRVPPDQMLSAQPRCWTVNLPCAFACLCRLWSRMLGPGTFYQFTQSLHKRNLPLQTGARCWHLSAVWSQASRSTWVTSAGNFRQSKTTEITSSSCCPLNAWWPSVPGLLFTISQASLLPNVMATKLRANQRWLPASSFYATV